MNNWDRLTDTFLPFRTVMLSSNENYNPAENMGLQLLMLAQIRFTHRLPHLPLSHTLLLPLTHTHTHTHTGVILVCSHTCAETHTRTHIAPIHSFPLTHTWEVSQRLPTIPCKTQRQGGVTNHILPHSASISFLLRHTILTHTQACGRATEKVTMTT